MSPAQSFKDTPTVASGNIAIYEEVGIEGGPISLPINPDVSVQDGTPGVSLAAAIDPNGNRQLFDLTSTGVIRLRKSAANSGNWTAPEIVAANPRPKLRSPLAAISRPGTNGASVGRIFPISTGLSHLTSQFHDRMCDFTTWIPPTAWSSWPVTLADLPLPANGTDRPGSPLQLLGDWQSSGWAPMMAFESSTCHLTESCRHCNGSKEGGRPILRSLRSPQRRSLACIMSRTAPELLP